MASQNQRDKIENTNRPSGPAQRDGRHEGSDQSDHKSNDASQRRSKQPGQVSSDHSNDNELAGGEDESSGEATKPSHQR